MLSVEITPIVVSVIVLSDAMFTVSILSLSRVAFILKVAIKVVTLML
jgi:hypothetical protein